MADTSQLEATGLFEQPAFGIVHMMAITRHLSHLDFPPLRATETARQTRGIPSLLAVSNEEDVVSEHCIDAVHGLLSRPGQMHQSHATSSGIACPAIVCQIPGHASYPEDNLENIARTAYCCNRLCEEGLASPIPDTFGLGGILNKS